MASGNVHCTVWMADKLLAVGAVMVTSSNGNIFRVTGNLCGEFTGPWWIPRTKASDAELWCFLDLRLNKRLGKQSWGWWFETLLRPLWRHSSVCRETVKESIVAKTCTDSHSQGGHKIYKRINGPVCSATFASTPDRKISAAVKYHCL